MPFVNSSNGTVRSPGPWLRGTESHSNRTRTQPSTINLRLAAIRRLAYEASDCGLLSPDLAAGIRRVNGVRRLGVRVGNWLTAEEGKKLLGAETAYTLRSRRNRALLSLLIGCGLRRAEVTTLRLEDLQLGPVRDCVVRQEVN